MGWLIMKKEFPETLFSLSDPFTLHLIKLKWTNRIGQLPARRRIGEQKQICPESEETLSIRRAAIDAIVKDGHLQPGKVTADLVPKSPHYAKAKKSNIT